jgi:hypothetical protein
MQEILIERRMFHGYSGTARTVGGLGALAGALVLSSPGVPATPHAHLIGWGAVLVFAVLANYGALAYWFLFDPEAKRSFLRLTPAVDAIPVLGVGVLLSAALIAHETYDLLFGTWMCVYGLIHVPYRISLPRANYFVGLFYVGCGAVCLLTPLGTFTNPWPMAVVFGVGETAGGGLLNQLRQTSRAGQEDLTEENPHARDAN